MSDIPYDALQNILAQSTTTPPLSFYLDPQQQLIFDNLNNFFTQDNFLRDRFFAWQEAFYNNFNYEVPRKITIAFNTRRSTGFTFSKNILESFCGYTSSNGHPLSGDYSQTKLETSPEYYRINVKNGPALHFQAEVNNYPNTTVPISAIFYTDVVTDDYKFALDKSNASINLINNGAVPGFNITQNGNSPAVKITQNSGADALQVYDVQNDTTPFVIDSAGKTGIGTSSPAAALDIVNLDTSVPGLRITQTGTLPAMVINTSNNANADFRFASATNNNLLFGDAGNSRIGINTANPGSNLEIFGITDVPSLIVNANNTDSDFQLGSTTSDFLLFGDAGNSRIGINTATPNSSLEISCAANVPSLIVNTNNTDSDFQFGSTASDYLLFGDAGNSRIGINTVNPSGSLEISCAANVPALVVNTGNTDSDFQFGSTTSDFLLFGDAGNSRIGINTATPNATLTIQGDVSATSRSTYQTYTNTGVVASTTTSNTLTINAETTTRATWIVNFCNISGETLQVSNLTDGREVFVYIRNTGSCGLGETADVTIRASTTTSGYSDVLCSNNGGNVRSNINLTSSNAAATVWVANIGGNIVGAIY